MTTGLPGNAVVDLIQVPPHVFGRALVPAPVVFVPLDEIHLRGHVAPGVLLQRVRRVGAQPPRIEPLRFRQQPPRERRRYRILPVDLVAQSPGHDARDGSRRSRSSRAIVPDRCPESPSKAARHPLKCVPAPGRHFGLHQNAVAVAVIEHAPVLRPVHAREHAVQLFQIVVVVRESSLRVRPSRNPDGCPPCAPRPSASRARRSDRNRRPGLRICGCRTSRGRCALQASPPPCRGGDGRNARASVRPAETVGSAMVAASPARSRTACAFARSATTSPVASSRMR